MKKILIAFDIDGTLRNNEIESTIVANERIRTLLIILSSFKNIKIMVWSGGGELYARQCAAAMGIEKYVDRYGDKMFGGYKEDGSPVFHTQEKVDIAIDDIHECTLGDINLIVNEKGFTPGYRNV